VVCDTGKNPGTWWWALWARAIGRIAAKAVERMWWAARRVEGPLAVPGCETGISASCDQGHPADGRDSYKRRNYC
jgi:hypothetical protein